MKSSPLAKAGLFSLRRFWVRLAIFAIAWILTAVLGAVIVWQIDDISASHWLAGIVLLPLGVMFWWICERWFYPKAFPALGAATKIVQIVATAVALYYPTLLIGIWVLFDFNKFVIKIY